MKRPSNQIRGPGGVLPIAAGDEAAVDLLMLVEGETSGRALDEVLQQYGRSRSTYFEKLRRFREGGLEALLARPPGPRTAWRRPLAVVRFVVTTRLRDPERSAAAIAAELGRLGHLVSVRSVERTLQQFGLTRPVPRLAAAPVTGDAVAAAPTSLPLDAALDAAVAAEPGLQLAAESA
jgi:transposase